MFCKQVNPYINHMGLEEKDLGDNLSDVGQACKCSVNNLFHRLTIWV